MKITAEPAKIILQNNTNFHNYFAWPSVAALKDGRLMMVTSGFRYQHVCPFGKSVGCISTDEGKTWTRPMVLIDTPLDDRDSGICAFGESSVMVTSFNNTAAFQRSVNVSYEDKDWDDRAKEEINYIHAYLDVVEKSGKEQDYLGSTFIISHDNGTTFGDIQRIPITSPHGPCELPDGTLLYVGRIYSEADSAGADSPEIHCYKVYPNGEYEKVAEIEKSVAGAMDCEPHAIVSGDKVIVHIRVQNSSGLFTTYQSEASLSDLKFSKPRRLLADKGGAPAHLLKHSSGALISVYGYREPPFGIRAMISLDNGETWSCDHVLYDNGGVSHDLGYPASVELSDGRILTVFYAHPDSAREPAVIMQTVWSVEE